MKDRKKLTAMLDVLCMLQDQSINQKFGCIYQNNISGKVLVDECGSCIGAWMAYAFNTPLRPHHDSGRLFWWFEDGILAFTSAIGKSQLEILNTLIKHGAPSVPFGTYPWQRDPYLVIRDTCNELAGLNYGEATIDSPDLVPANGTLVPV